MRVRTFIHPRVGILKGYTTEFISMDEDQLLFGYTFRSTDISVERGKNVVDARPLLSQTRCCAALILGGT